MKKTAAQTLKDGRAWVEANPKGWARLLSMTTRDAKRGRRELRIAAYVEQLRADGVSVPNYIRPYLSRRLEYEVEGAEFTKAKSKIAKAMQALYEGE